MKVAYSGLRVRLNNFVTNYVLYVISNIRTVARVYIMFEARYKTKFDFETTLPPIEKYIFPQLAFVIKR